MTPYHEPATLIWWIKLGIFWLSWLAWPMLAGQLWRCWRQRRAPWWRQLGNFVPVLLLMLSLQARFIEPTLIIERQTTLNLGFKARVAVIADYHLGIYKGSHFLSRVVDRLNAMELDAVLIAGDHLYHPDRPVDELLAPLKKLRHRAYSVPGNHDEEQPGPPVSKVLREALVGAGVTPVEYSHADLGSFTLVGLGDRFAGRDLPDALRRAPRHKPIVVLVHNPDSVTALKPGEAALAISGHTHGGQIRIPWLYRSAIPCLAPFDRGFHTFSPVPVFVTSGLGEIGLPLRFLNPPSIDVLDIY